MAAAEDDIPILFDEIDEIDEKPKTGLLTTDDLESYAVPVEQKSFNTCTRSGDERRQRIDRRQVKRPECSERRSGRDRRIFSYY